MGLIGFLVELDSPHDTYYSGSVINGKVIFRLDKPKAVRGIRIEVKGAARTSWTRTESRRHYGYDRDRTTFRTVYYSGSRDIFYREFYILGGSDGKIRLSVGLHEYPFTDKLALDIPSTYDGTYGSIWYRVKAVLDRPWRFDHEVNKYFRVVQVRDLNTCSESLTEVREESEKSFCCLCCKSGPLRVNFTIPHSGYVPGQDIPVALQVKNTSSVRVRSVDVDLEENCKYRAYYPRYDSRFSSSTVTGWTLPGVEPFQTRTFSPQLTVPHDQSPDISNCDIITVWYDLLVTLRVGKLHKNLRVETDIEIGTIPIYKPSSHL